MDSYVAAPDAHVAASANPGLLGGPFVNYANNRSDEIARLAESTRATRGDLLDLSAAIDALDSLLAGRADGHSLEPLYCAIPAPLRGCVELLYDRAHRASFRLIEPLLYRGPYYRPDAQSLMLRRIDGDDRPFILSTPRLDDDDSFHLPVPFADARVDAVLNLRTQPASLSSIRDILGGSDRDAQALVDFFHRARAASRVALRRPRPAMALFRPRHCPHRIPRLRNPH